MGSSLDVSAVGEPRDLYDEEPRPDGFSVNLTVYSGPFDVLLSMIADKRLELTEVALSAITQEFLDFVAQLSGRMLDDQQSENVRLDAVMDNVSAFVDVASILLEAKSAALLPGDEEGKRDEQSMEALRERDLLFARLVQYRAFKRAGDEFRSRIARNSGSFPHRASLDAHVSSMLPELAWNITPQQLAALAAAVFSNAPIDEISLRQLHIPMVDLQAQASAVRRRLMQAQARAGMSFGQLVADAKSDIEVVARFLSVLLFFKQGSLQFKQAGPFETLFLRWVHADNADDDKDTDTIINEGDFS